MRDPHATLTQLVQADYPGMSGKSLTHLFDVIKDAPTSGAVVTALLAVLRHPQRELILPWGSHALADLVERSLTEVCAREQQAPSDM